jgi:hypothetical protein
MGRRPWSTRITCEESAILRVRDLVTSGAINRLRTQGTLCDSSAENPRVATFEFNWTCFTDGHELLLRLIPALPGTDSLQPPQEIRIIHSACNYGGRRYWFLCPGLGLDGCDLRVTGLYLPPGESAFACRRCYRLTYTSTKQHDKRIGFLVRNPDVFRSFLQSGNIRRQLLALRAAMRCTQKLSPRMS